ncbi:HD domain-containing protein [Haliangium ochraceum]|uniref:HD domain-containing protein n=1 Tax=Haliangium ochraceum TaxID=80816 RepID=UPI0018F027B8|nr:HD domain-containing protein [Haliangium ochraceum]
MFRDPVHGIIELRGDDRALAPILETRAFQRLRRIKQMGFAWLVYPGAEHSRFGHALGAFHLANRVTRALAVEPSLARLVKIAALLHDIGHGPFSHAWEQVFAGADHERWSMRIASESGELCEVLSALDPGLPQQLVGFWDKSHRPAFARKLVSSQLDVDRLDYLLRDGHYSGVGYATFDLDWILHALRIEPIRGGSDPADLVVDYRRGKFAVEQYLFARSYMYAQVYHHKTVRSAEWMFVKLMQRFSELARAGDEPASLPAAARLARESELPVAAYLSLDDIAVTHAIDVWSGEGAAGEDGAAVDPVLRDLALRLTRRRLFKTIDLGDEPGVIERLRARVHEAAEARFGEAAGYYYHLDNARQIGYRKVLGEELYVVDHPRYGTVKLGRLLDDMPLGQPTSTVRLVCAPELLDILEPIAESALST